MRRLVVQVQPLAAEQRRIEHQPVRVRGGAFHRPIIDLPDRFFRQARIRPNSPAYYVRRNDQWVGTTWRDYGKQVRQASCALHALGIEAEQSVCILGFNRPEWVIMDLANMVVGGAPAGIYTTCSPNEVQYIIEHAGAPLILVENIEQWEKVKVEREKASLKPNHSERTLQILRMKTFYIV